MNYPDLIITALRFIAAGTALILIATHAHKES